MFTPANVDAAVFLLLEIYVLAPRFNIPNKHLFKHKTAVAEKAQA